MTQYVIVRINDQLIPEFQINYDSKSKLVNNKFLKAWSDIEVKANQSLMLSLSANLVLNSQVKIPSKNEEVIKQSIPFAVEEDLADDIDLNHFAYVPLKDGEFIVSTIKKSIMDSIVEYLKSHDLKPKGLFSEIFSCPLKDSEMIVCHLKTSSIVRDGYSGTTLNNNSLKTYLKLSKHKNISIYSETNLSSQSQNINVIHVNNLSLVQAKALIENTKANLFQGAYDLANKDSVKVNPWRKVALLLTVLIISWVSIHGYLLINLNNEINDLRDQQKQLLLKMVPNASSTELNDPYAAVLSKSKSLDGTLNNSSNNFLSSLLYLGLTLQSIDDVIVQSIRLRENKFEISVFSQNVANINQFQSSLEANSYSMRVKTGTRETTKDGVNAILTMEVL